MDASEGTSDLAAPVTSTGAGSGLHSDGTVSSASPHHARHAGIRDIPKDKVIARAIGLYKVYGRSADTQVVALDHLNVDFEKAKMTAIMGPSGSGKSTLMHCMAGLDTPSSGQVIVEGLEVSSMKQKQLTKLRREQIGFIFQSFNLVPTLTAEENILLPLQIGHKRIDRSWFDRIVDVVGLKNRLDHRPSQLSGGQQQRVALGRALVAHPEILLLDEPLSNLDAKLREEMRYEIKEITKKLKITVIYVTHDQIEAMTMSDRIVLINKGEVQQVGTPQEIYSRPANVFVANFVGKVDFMKGKVENGNILLNNSNGQTLPNTSSYMKDVIVAIRPENVMLAEDGELIGKVFSKFYLGDCNDLRVEVGNGNILRVTARASTYDTLKVGEEVRLKVLEYFVFEDDGKDQTKIMT